MTMVIIGVVLILTGFFGISNLDGALSIVSLLICFVGGGLLVYLGIKRIKNPQPKNEHTSQSDISSSNINHKSKPEGTYTFEPVGTRYECRFPNKITLRNTALKRSKVGDPISLREYEWEGKPALALINDRLGVDIGVAKKGPQLRTILDLSANNDVQGRISKISCYEYKDDLNYKCEIELIYFKKAGN